MSRSLIVLAVSTLVACAGTEGLDGRPGITGQMGDKGDPGMSASPGITAVEPRTVAVGIETEVAISGVGTTWSEAASVSFGDGITVTRVRAPSANALVVDIKMAANAALDTRDIVVAQGSSTLAYRNVFTVIPLVTLATSGKAARGSVATVVVTNHDPAFEFDTSWSGSIFTGVTATLSPGTAALVRDVKPHTVTLLVGFDTDAPLGMRDLKLVSAWRRPSEVTFSFPAVFDVVDATEQVLPVGMPMNATFAEAFESALYKFTPSSTSVEMLASVTTTNGKGTPMLVAVPTGGHFTTTSLAYVNSYSFTPYSLIDYRWVAIDPSGASGVSYAVSVIQPMKSPEVEPNDSAALAQTLTPPVIVSLATMSSAMDFDYYKVAVGQGELGRALRMRSRQGDYSTDVKIELLAADGSTVMGPVDLAYHEDARSPALTTAGDYYVRLSWGRYTTSPWSTYSSRYELLVNWE